MNVLKEAEKVEEDELDVPEKADAAFEAKSGCCNIGSEE